MNAYRIGTSALSAGQQWLNTVGQNVANATTPGYHRQIIDFSASTVNGEPTGVDVASISRFTAPPVRAAILRSNADASYAATRLSTSQQVEAVLSPASGAIGEGLDNFFNSVESLSSNPTDAALRRGVVAAASDLAGRFNSAANNLRQLRTDVGNQIPKAVEDVNRLATKIASLNKEIGAISRTGGQPNDLMDQRDQLVDQLSKKIDVRMVQQPFGVVNVSSSSGSLVIGDESTKIGLGTDSSGRMVVTPEGTSTPLALRSGSLAAQLHDYNDALPAVQSRLDNLAKEFMRQVNAVQASGLGSAGPQAQATGTTSVSDPTATLASAGLPFPVQSGTLTFSLTDTATGTRSEVAISIDPATQSLNDVAAAIASGTGGRVQATVGSPGNQLQLQAASGSRFDFTSANADTAGLLPALGIGGLFSGGAAADIKVPSEFQSNPALLAASKSGAAGDATNLESIVALRDVAAVSGRTFASEFADQAATVGLDVSQLADLETAQNSLVSGLAAQEQSVVGVDLNEEMVHLLDAQRMIQSASKYLSVVNDAMQSVMSIIR